MPLPMLLFLLAVSPATPADATCDAKPFTLGTVHKSEAKPAPKVAQATPPKPAKPPAPKAAPKPAGIAPCKDDKAH
jgi:hypothetical protein